MKKILLVLLVCLCVVGCGKKTEKKEVKPTTDSWNIPTEFETYLPLDEADLFYKATMNESEFPFPVALLGKQVVSGTNYMFLVQKDSEYYVYVIYQNLEKNLSITSKKKFDLTKYTNENKKMDTKTLAGGWEVELIKDDIPSMRLDDKTQKIFEEASSKITDKKFYPLTVLATQQVSGTNYAVIAYGTDKVENSNSTNGVYILTLYKDLKGTSEIVSISNIDLSDYNK